MTIFVVLVIIFLRCDMAEKISEDNNSIVFELDQDDNIFGWLLNSYMGSKIEGKLVTMDEKMLLNIMNSRSCEVDRNDLTHSEEGVNQKIRVFWNSEGKPIVRADICLEGSNPVVYRWPHFAMEGKGENRIYFSDVEFSHSIKNAKNFVYAKNKTNDLQVVHIKYAPQKKLELTRE